MKAELAGLVNQDFMKVGSFRFAITIAIISLNVLVQMA